MRVVKGLLGHSILCRGIKPGVWNKKSSGRTIRGFLRLKEMTAVGSEFMRTDAELVKQVLRGDIEIFEEIVARYEKKVYGLAFRMLRNHEDASDAAQEAFLKIYRSLASFKGSSKFSTWVYRITTNVCLDMLRQRKKRSAYSLDDPLQLDDGEVLREMAADCGDPDERLYKKELMAALSKAIGELPDEQRFVVVLRDIYGLSYGEISKALGVPLGTVKSRLNRARNAIQDTMQKYKELLPHAMRLSR